MKNLTVRRDKYHGWRLYWQGCPDPGRGFKQMYVGHRGRGSSRPVAAAVAGHTVFGWHWCLRYLVACGWTPGGRMGAR